MILDSLQILFDSFDSFKVQINDQNLPSYIFDSSLDLYPVVKCDMGFVMMFATEMEWLVHELAIGRCHGTSTFS